MKNPKKSKIRRVTSEISVAYLPQSEVDGGVVARQMADDAVNAVATKSDHTQNCLRTDQQHVLPSTSRDLHSRQQ